MSQPFRIAHLIDTLSWGGAQKLLITFAETARGYGITPTVISLRPRNDSPFTDQLTALGVPVIELPFQRIIELPLLSRLVRLLRQERFDILHTHLTQANIVGGVLGPLTGTPVVASIHNTVTRVRRLHGPRQAIETAALRFGARRSIAVGHVVAEAQAERLRHARMVTIPNAVSIVPPLPADERRAVRAELAGDPDAPLLIAVGRITAQKGYDDLINAFATVGRQHPHAVLAIVGRGDQQEQIAAQVATLGLAERVRLLGARSDVPRLLAASDLYVSSSRWEGLPIAVLEAMSAGLPVVATRVGDIPHVVPASTGIVVTPGQPQQLADAITELLGDPGQMRRSGAAARAHILAHYGPELWVRRLLELYAQVARRPAAVAHLLEQKQLNHA